jgi:hypothetical protein
LVRHRVRTDETVYTITIAGDKPFRELLPAASRTHGALTAIRWDGQPVPLDDQIDLWNDDDMAFTLIGVTPAPSANPDIAAHTMQMRPNQLDPILAEERAGALRLCMTVSTKAFAGHRRSNRRPDFVDAWASLLSFRLAPFSVHGSSFFTSNRDQKIYVVFSRAFPHPVWLSDNVPIVCYCPMRFPNPNLDAHFRPPPDNGNCMRFLLSSVCEATDVGYSQIA